MKYSIGQNKLNDFIYNMIDDYYRNHPEGNLTWDDESYDNINFYFSESEEPAFKWYGTDYFFEPDRRCPMVIVEHDMEDYFNGLFNNMWHEPFKKWLMDKFSLEVKTIE